MTDPSPFRSTDPAVDPARYAADVRALADERPAADRARPADRRDPHGAYAAGVEVPTASDGPLDDLRMAVKDNVAVAGVELTAGGAVSTVPDRHATVVSRLLDAGATLVATTAMDALAFGTTGELAPDRVSNPAAPGRVSGGSSAGSAAAVAGGLVDAAVGTDTGGSVRIPASYCGVVGVKPTYGLVPRTGVAPLAPSMDHVGVLARDVPTAARALAAAAGPDPADVATLHASTPDPSLPPLDGEPTVGLLDDALDASAAQVTAAVTDALDAAPVAVDRVACPGYEDAPLVNDALTLLAFAALLRGADPGYAPPDGWASALADCRDRGLPVPDPVREHAALGTALLDDPVAGERAAAARARFARAVAALYGDADVDVLVTPTTPTTAPAYGEVATPADVHMTLRHTAPFDVTGSPAVSVPCGVVEGRPVGLQVVAPAGRDRLALRIARAVADATPAAGPGG